MTQERKPFAGPKYQRWVDLIAALLCRTGSQTFDEIAREVPAYTGDNRDSVKRMFERDKEELRLLGVPIETVGSDGDAESMYKLRTTDFYLPYLNVLRGRGIEKPDHVDRYGYRALTELTFDADELSAVSQAANRARQLGDPALTDDATSAMRKLAFDLPMDVDTPRVVIAEPRAAADPAVLRTISSALFSRKRLTVEYASISSQATAKRDVEPYGLFFLNAHWYLAARDLDGGQVKNFRVSRVKSVKPNAARPKDPDYEIPANFDLREHARSRQAWEIGSDAAIEAIVEFRGSSGATEAASSLGASVPNHARRRSFSVRRPDSFVRWVMSFAGEIVPVAPAEIVDEYRRQLTATARLYG